MTTPPDVEPLPAAVVTWPQVPVPLQHKAPVLDADFDDIVPGYSDSDSWYEP